MKLNTLNEGLAGDLVGLGTSKLQSKLRLDRQILAAPGIKELLGTAQELVVSLLDSGPTQDKWWGLLLQTFGIDQNQSATLKSLKKRIEPLVVRDKEDLKKRHTDLEARKQAKEEKRERKQKEKAERRRARLYGYDSERRLERRARIAKLRQALGESVLSTIPDLLDPKLREAYGSKLALKANNLRIASMAVELLYKRFGIPKRNRKQAPNQKPTKSAPATKSKPANGQQQTLITKSKDLPDSKNKGTIIRLCKACNYELQKSKPNYKVLKAATQQLAKYGYQVMLRKNSAGAYEFVGLRPT